MARINIANLPRISIKEDLNLYTLGFAVDENIMEEQETKLLNGYKRKIDTALKRHKAQGEEIHVFIGLSRRDVKTGEDKKLHGHGFVLAAKASARAQTVCDMLNKRKSGVTIARKFTVTSDFATAMHYCVKQCDKHRTYSTDEEKLYFSTLLNTLQNTEYGRVILEI